jgi:hypothetical protein
VSERKKARQKATDSICGERQKRENGEYTWNVAPVHNNQQQEKKDNRIDLRICVKKEESKLVGKQ